MSDPVYVKINIGEQAQDYQIGNLINALNELVCYYLRQSGTDDDQIADAIEMFAKHMRG